MPFDYLDSFGGAEYGLMLIFCLVFILYHQLAHGVVLRQQFLILDDIIAALETGLQQVADTWLLGWRGVLVNRRGLRFDFVFLVVGILV